ncbi:MBL fold metallo-hydrolase [Halohasta litorea]|uniref:MBL fold metallo-hydrolase n=1 Tax=Halohasta litorea TaxID=869891 RepID=A0ABD6D871_9EURY|nr:MBL fold metallo-hydrolase [Halohasta litorea]
MRVTLLGTGDTTGTPTVGCDCETCGAARERGVERSRFSVHVENERTDESILIDFSPDFRHQFLTHDVDLPDAAVITHIHFDHIDGLGNAYRVFDSLPVYAADEVDPQTGESVADTVRDKYDYLDTVTVHDVTPFEPIEVCGLELTFVPVDHPPLVCYGLVIEDPQTGAKLSLSGDTSYDVPEESRQQLRDPDLFLVDGIVPASLCEYHPIGGADHDADGVPRTFGTKHMTREGALSLAADLDAETTRLVHTAHYYPADEAFEEPLAVDGEQYRLDESGVTRLDTDADPRFDQ